MRLRRSLANTLVAGVVLATAILTVGLTASTNSPFVITIHPVFLRLGIDVDVKIGAIHLHAAWSALPQSTKDQAEPF